MSMQIFVSSFLLVQCFLVSLVYGECPKVKECMQCSGNADCVLNADNTIVECVPANITQCQPQTCNTEFYTCMALWARSSVNDEWSLTSSCLSAGTADPCETGPICETDFTTLGTLPDTVATGSFYCQCYGNFCNQNFLANINADPPVSDVSSTSTVGTVSMAPTPMVQLGERDCINCTTVQANCTLSENNRSLECFIDNECTNNIVQCSSNEMCAATWSRQTSSAPWLASALCFSFPSADDSRCEGRSLGQPSPPDSLEVGRFFCTCRGALCNREFGIALPELSPSTTSTSMPISSVNSTILISVTSAMIFNSSTPVIFNSSTPMIFNSSTPMIFNSSTPVPADVTRSTVDLTSPGSPTSVGVDTDGINATKSTEPATSITVRTDGLSGDDIIAVSVSLTVVFCLIVFAILVAGFCIYARRPPKVGQREWDLPEAGLREALSQLPVEPLEIVGNGRFGTVWKAKLHEDMVACKILCFKEAKSWENEQMLYSLPSTAHPNILEYIGSEQKGQGYEAQYLMILKYCPLGSLSSYLKGHTLTWNQACNFINSALAGVAHLHAESYYDAEGICREKAPIAHRDIKSSNFLVKSDSGECVLSDLGVSLQLKSNMDVSELASIGQVGTYRYMSPEALDASVNLQDPESFKQIDMYALALVLWEIASRCPAHEGDTVPEYSLPFSREVGERTNPTLDAMRAIVVHGRKRPKIPESWKIHEGLSVLAESIPECWDQDPEARLTAAGVLGRMEEALEIKGPNRQKIKLIRSQAESTSSCESGSCEQTISSVSSKNCDSTEVITEEATTVNDISNTYEDVVANDDTDTRNTNRAEEVTVDASEIH